ncbi:hypothetical protein T11_3084 [Trichinella zimbabwensis]|uniref:Uncharacterized protein n=1 Tax=Trichinella zimbabwensis TaxID=268475 RepID=A0A0V1I1G1_9BILA|nr:hypothetical protein T11_3084 [Trichinella zimbabwensis]
MHILDHSLLIISSSSTSGGDDNQNVRLSQNGCHSTSDSCNDGHNRFTSQSPNHRYEPFHSRSSEMKQPASFHHIQDRKVHQRKNHWHEIDEPSRSKPEV